MLVQVEHGKLLRAVRALEQLADHVSSGVAQSTSGTPIDLPSLDPLPAKAVWMRDQVPDLESLAALALLLDSEGTGAASFEMPGTTWDVEALLDTVVAQRFGPDFAEDTGLSEDQLRELLITFGSVGQDLPPEADPMTPDELRSLIIAHPDLARALTELSPRPGAGPEGTLFGLLQPAFTTPEGGAAFHEERRLDARNLFESLPPEQASILAMMFPSTVGDLHGVPFDNLADANTVRIVVALEDERANLADLEERHEDNQHDWDFLGLNNDNLEDPIKKSGKLIDLYQSILDDERQILYFDPSGDGAMAELHGPIDRGTTNVGVLVPGTESELSGFGGLAARSSSFQNHDPRQSLAMISWMGGDFPDTLLDAPSPSYSEDLAPRLADFSRDVRLEIERSGSEARTTYAGHSYGGAVVGLSETYQLDADRVLHIESAGAGHGVDRPSDLPSSQRDVDRYSMTAPGDFIENTQGIEIGGIGHGADPDDFADVRLHTGDYPDSDRPIRDGGSHSDVFTPRSDAWRNMYEVFTGGEVQTYRSPDYTYISTGRGVVRVQDGWNDDGEQVDIE